jgi:DNA helicase II / ATP-dependent DNA helicase PcrA
MPVVGQDRCQPPFSLGFCAGRCSKSQGIWQLATLLTHHQDARVRVMAGPGTGKSYAMMRRLMRLLEEGAPPRRILLVTFTRTAAADLVANIEKLGVAGCEDIWAGTLHAFCFRLLAKREVLAQTDRTPRPLVTFSDKGVLQFEAAPMLEDLGRVVAAGHKRERTRRIRAYEADWARLQSDVPGAPRDPIDTAFRDELLKWLKFHKAMLIGELVPVALDYLRTNPACTERSAFDHVLVDEYQDLNKAEQVLVGQLIDGAGYCIFGDEDQSIYSFRWAHPEGIIEFDQMYPPTKDYKLDECRRCPTKVVELSDQLIRNNHTAGMPSRLFPRPGNTAGEVHVVQWEGLDQEANGIAEFVRFLLDRRGYQPGDILVLSPRRLIGYRVRDALLASDIPTHSFYHEGALETAEAKAAFCLLTLLANRDDRVALRYWLGDGSDTWNARAYAVLRGH